MGFANEKNNNNNNNTHINKKNILLFMNACDFRAHKICTAYLFSIPLRNFFNDSSLSLSLSLFFNMNKFIITFLRCVMSFIFSVFLLYLLIRFDIILTFAILSLSLSLIDQVDWSRYFLCSCARFDWCALLLCYYIFVSRIRCMANDLVWLHSYANDSRRWKRPEMTRPK